MMDIERAVEILTNEIQDNLPECKWKDYEQAIDKVFSFANQSIDDTRYLYGDYEIDEAFSILDEAIHYVIQLSKFKTDKLHDVTCLYGVVDSLRRRIYGEKNIICNVCGCINKPKRERTVFVNESPFNNFHYEDVMTCSGCGCQIRLKEVIDPVVEGPLVERRTISILENYAGCLKKKDCEKTCEICKYKNYTYDELVRALEEATEILKGE